MRERAHQMEFMTQLISSLGHELNTPLTEVTKRIELLRMKVKGKSNSPAKSKLGSSFLFGRSPDQKQSAGFSLVKISSEPQQTPEIPSESLQSASSYESKLDIDVEKATDFVHQTSMKMSYLIGSMLTYSQILNGQSAFTSIAEFLVRPLLEEIVYLFREKCEKKGLSIKIICSPDLKVNTDRSRLLGCLCLFIDNSVKFTNETGERIFLSAEVSDSKSQVVFKVIDLGNGINKRDMAIITRIMANPFTTTVTSSSAGLGIGLRMAECIISELTGSTGRCLEIHSKLQSGTTVSFQLPMKTSHSAVTPKSALKPTNMSIAGLVGMALLKPKLMQNKESNANYESEREKLLGPPPVLETVPNEYTDESPTNVDTNTNTPANEEANFKQNNQMVSSLLVPVGRGVLPNASRLRRASLNSTRFLNSLKGSRILSSIVVSKETKNIDYQKHNQENNRKH